MTEMSWKDLAFIPHHIHSCRPPEAFSHVGEPPGWTVPWTPVAPLAQLHCSWSPLRPVPGMPLAPGAPTPRELTKYTCRQYLKPISTSGCRPERCPRAFHVILENK